MIEKEGLLVHLDPAGDRIAGRDFEFSGWVAATRPITAISLPAAGPDCLTISDRPDVRRIFPDRIAVGFAGKCAAAAIGPNGLRIRIQLENEAREVDHPVPDALPNLSLGQRLGSAFQFTWLRLRERLTGHPSTRFASMLRRHLIARRLRGGVFERRHTDALLQDFATAFPRAFFLQIGANDGFTGDPVYPLITRADVHWRGVLVEPVAHLFAELSQRHGHNPALRLERAAICEHDGSTVIHRLTTRQTDPLWLDQIPSLDRELLRAGAKQFGTAEEAVVEEEVSSLTVATLLERHAIAQLDFLVIDAEGWDWRILRQFDLRNLSPKLILYEHQHLRPDERDAAHQFLAALHYGWVETKEGDTLAWYLPGTAR
jgi:FkbM family methyltransferase